MEQCRICLYEIGESDSVGISTKVLDETVLELITVCASIKISEEDFLPQFVCKGCFAKLKDFREFRNKIIKSDTKLKEKFLKECSFKIELSKINEIPEDDFKSLDTGQNIVKEELLNDFRLEMENDILSVRKESEEGQKPTRTKKIYECKECNKTYKKADHYNVHVMTKHTGEKRFACEFCPKRFARSCALVYHRRVHTGEKPHKCNICSKSFTTPSNYYAHMKIHNGERKFKCTMCDESFTQSESLTIHVRRIHTGERPYMCEICSSTFRSTSTLFTHKQDIHKNKEMCPICNKMYSTRVLKVHIRRHKDKEEGIKRFVCDQCGKKFTCTSSRKKHLLIHSGEKPFSCEICNKSFNQKSSLKTHMKVHSDAMPFQCDFCAKSFKYKHHLKSHLETHQKSAIADEKLNSWSESPS